MLDWFRFALSAVLTLGGLFAIISGILGVFRFRGALSRMHAAALIDTVGMLLMLLGLMVADGLTITTGKMLVIICILWLTSPVCSHLLGRMEVIINDKLHKSMTIQDPDTVRRMKEGK